MTTDKVKNTQSVCFTEMYSLDEHETKLGKMGLPQDTLPTYSYAEPKIVTCINTSPNDIKLPMDSLETEKTAIVVQQPTTPMITEDKLQLVKEMCCKNCTDSEFAFFIELANRYHLDPFAHQIWAVKYDKSKPAQIFCGRDGFLAIAHRSGVFDGIHSVGNYENNKLVSATATVWRKDFSHPFQITVRLKEYHKGNSVWNSMPDTMLCKVAECQCLRKAFSISGLFDPTEVPVNMTTPYMDATPYTDADFVEFEEESVISKPQPISFKKGGKNERLF